MRDLIMRKKRNVMRQKRYVIGLAMFGVLVGVGCGVASAQYRAQSPNYSLEYIEENLQTSPPAVQGEAQAQEQATPATAAELPATNPPFPLIGAVIVAVGIAVAAYFVLR